jgi:hypothetical protein
MNWTQYEILLPLRYNDGRGVEPGKFDQTNLELRLYVTIDRRAPTCLTRLLARGASGNGFFGGFGNRNPFVSDARFSRKGLFGRASRLYHHHVRGGARWVPGKYKMQRCASANF